MGLFAERRGRLRKDWSLVFSQKIEPFFSRTGPDYLHTAPHCHQLAANTASQYVRADRVPVASSMRILSESILVRRPRPLLEKKNSIFFKTGPGSLCIPSHCQKIAAQLLHETVHNSEDVTEQYLQNIVYFKTAAFY